MGLKRCPIPDGTGFETRDEIFSIRGNQPALSGNISWKRPNGHILNAKASYSRLDLNRRQSTVNSAITPRGMDGSSLAQLSAIQDNFRFDTDYSLPALGGNLKLIGLARRGSNEAVSRLTIEDPLGNRLADQAFEESSSTSEGILRFEQQWSGDGDTSWQLAGEGAFNALDLETVFLTFSNASPADIVSQIPSATKVEELRGELTLAHRRRLGANSNLQISLGGELSQISQGSFARGFFRPKGFAAYTIQPGKGWTFVARIDRQVGQINFRDFAATVSLFDEVSTQDNVDLVPQQSWVFSGRAERVFNGGHIAALNVTHERITDIVDRIPIGASGDAVGNIPSASRWGVDANFSLLGASFGVPGARLDLKGAWQWSSVTDPIGGFQRDIGNLRLRDMSIRFRHDLPGTDLSYGFEFQDIKLAPVFRSTFVQFRNIPGGALSPGTNAVFAEHKNLFGLRARIQVSEFLGQKSRFRRAIFAGRRDAAPIDRVEQRERSLNGPVITLSFGRSF